MKKKRTATKIMNYYTDVRAFWLLSMMLVGLCVLYFIFTAQTVSNIVERQNVSQELAVLNAEIGELEFQLIRKRNNINLARIDDLNMIQQSNAVYISRPTLGHRTQQGQF